MATVAVYDRRGHRVVTIYLGQMPQAQQTALSDDLTRILTSVLQAWEGPMPRLVYVTDAGRAGLAAPNAAQIETGPERSLLHPAFRSEVSQ